MEEAPDEEADCGGAEPDGGDQRIEG